MFVESGMPSVFAEKVNAAGDAGPAYWNRNLSLAVLPALTLAFAPRRIAASRVRRRKKESTAVGSGSSMQIQLAPGAVPGAVASLPKSDMGVQLTGSDACVRSVSRRAPTTGRHANRPPNGCPPRPAGSPKSRLAVKFCSPDG